MTAPEPSPAPHHGPKLSPSSSNATNTISGKRTFHLMPFFDTVTNVYEEPANSAPTTTSNQSTLLRTPSPRISSSYLSYIVTHTPSPKRSHHLFHSAKADPLFEIEVEPQFHPSKAVLSCCRVYPLDAHSSSICLFSRAANVNKDLLWPDAPLQHEWSHNGLGDAASSLMTRRKALVCRAMAWGESWYEGTLILELRDAAARREGDEVVARAAFARNLQERKGTVEVYPRFDDNIESDIFVADVLVSLMGELEVRKMTVETEEDDGVTVERTYTASSKIERKSGFFGWTRERSGSQLSARFSRSRSPSDAVAGAVTSTALAGTRLGGLLDPKKAAS